MHKELAQAFGIRQPINYGISKDTPLNTVIKNAVTVIFTIGAILLIFMLLWGGIDWIMSAGDKEKAASARKKITSALIGLVVLALTYLIAYLLGSIVGFNPLQPLNLPALNAP